MRLGARPLLVMAAVAHAGCSDSVVNTLGPPADMAMSAGNYQSAPVGTQLSSPIAVKVIDAEGRGVPNQRVDFFVTAGNGAVREPSSITNDFGVAATWWTIGERVTDSQKVAARLLD